MPLINRLLLGSIGVIVVGAAILFWVQFGRPLWERFSLGGQPTDSLPASANGWQQYQLEESGEVELSGVRVALDKVEVRELGFPFGRLTEVTIAVEVDSLSQLVRLSASEHPGYQVEASQVVAGYEIHLLRAKGVGHKSAVLEIRKTPA